MVAASGNAAGSLAPDAAGDRQASETSKTAVVNHGGTAGILPLCAHLSVGCNHSIPVCWKGNYSNGEFAPEVGPRRLGSFGGDVHRARIPRGSHPSALVAVLVI